MRIFGPWFCGNSIANKNAPGAAAEGNSIKRRKSSPLSRGGRRSGTNGMQMGKMDQNRDNRPKNWDKSSKNWDGMGQTDRSLSYVSNTPWSVKPFFSRHFFHVVEILLVNVYAYLVGQDGG
jgi:hypothetical protein